MRKLCVLSLLLVILSGCNDRKSKIDETVPEKTLHTIFFWYGNCRQNQFEFMNNLTQEQCDEIVQMVKSDKFMGTISFTRNGIETTINLKQIVFMQVT